MAVGNPYDRLKGLLPSNEDLGLDGYEVLAPLGEGGFGRVYRARQPAFDRDVAVKLLAATGVGDDIARRFERECRAVGTLSGHPHIVTLFDCGVTRWGRPFIVMEHMAGGSLAEALRASGPLEWTTASDAVIKIASAIETAHRAGILHRDIKPENLLLSAYGEPKLADFGIASIPGGYQTHTGAVTASLVHAAPEILEGSGAGRALDVYSLGSTLFALVAGAPAFSSEDGSGLQALIARVLTQPVPDLRGQGVPGPVCDVIERAMAKNPAERFASAHRMAVALREAQVSLGADPTDIVLDAADAVVYPSDATARADDGSVTRTRERRELTPPAIERPSRRSRWRSSAFVAAAVLLVSASAAGALVLNVQRTPRPRATAAPSGTVEDLDPDVDASTAPRPEPVSRERRDRRGTSARSRDAARDGGTVALGGSYGGSVGYEEGGYAAPEPAGDAGTDPAGGSRPSRNAGGGGSNGGSSQPEPEEPIPGHQTRATIVLYHHWSDSGEYFFTAHREESENALLIYDHRHSEGYVWATSKPGDGLIPICYSNERGCYGFASQDRPTSGQYRTLYWYPGARYGHYYSTDPTETYRGEPLTVFGYIRGSST